jgi:hypothetical protein
MNAPSAPRDERHNRPPAPPPLRKPLYLDGAHLRGIALEGPALKVEDDLGRLRHYPLARLSRIVLRGEMRCDTGVLQALLAAGLSLIIIGKEGEALGWLASAEPLLISTLQQRLEEAEGLGLLQQTLEDWRLSRLRLMILRHVVPYLPGTHPSDLRARTMRSRANNLIYRRCGLDWRKIMRRFRPLLQSLALQRLQEAGVDAQWLGADAARPNMARFFAQLLEWPLWGAALRHRKLAAPASWRGEIAFFEAHRETLDQEMQSLLADLEHNLQDAIFHLRSLA